VAPAPGKIVGRAAEIAALRAFRSRPAPAALVIEGDAGCGKTTVWEAALDGGGGRVLVARPIEGESALSLSGVGDLLAGVDPSASTVCRGRSAGRCAPRSFSTSPTRTHRRIRARSPLRS
jgi:hypothetical protein